MSDSSESDPGREEKECFRVVTKAVRVDEVVAENAFHAEQKAASVYRHTDPAAEVSAVKSEKINFGECNPGAKGGGGADDGGGR